MLKLDTRLKLPDGREGLLLGAGDPELTDIKELKEERRIAAEPHINDPRRKNDIRKT